MCGVTFFSRSIYRIATKSVRFGHGVGMEDCCLCAYSIKIVSMSSLVSFLDAVVDNKWCINDAISVMDASEGSTSHACTT